jgi:glutamate synthase (NADPH/NADH) small chain
MAAFTLAFVGWLNEAWLMWFENPIWLNRYTEYGIILAFGIWRIFAEDNSYTRKRLIILVSMVTLFWWLIPWLYPFYEPYVGFLWAQPVFPSLHVPGTITFFLLLGAVFLFGRRIICGFNCPCVGIRETVGFAFRDRTLRSELSWALRHSKWIFFIYYVGIMVVTQFPPNSWTVSFVGGFYGVVALTYFGSFFIAPIVGNRFYCRYLCPYGATFGLLNHAGFYGIKMDKEKCIDCQRCEQVCDMGIPVWKQGQAAGRVTALEDCMGCARCVVSCPTDALEIRDVRNLFNKALVQNASHLLKREIAPGLPRQETAYRQADERKHDWSEITLPANFADIQAQASRCMDCGLPACMNACPLHNNIPQWLEQVAAGHIRQAADLAHRTSNLPEICGTLCPQHRLCEGACTKAKTPGGSVTIGAIERYLVDSALTQGWLPPVTSPSPTIGWRRWFPASPPSLRSPRHTGEGKSVSLRDFHLQHLNKKIAIIGAGPAGLACADELSKAGCAVTVYDKHHRIGGLLDSGVPAFKLDPDLLQRRQQLLERQGVVFRLNTMVSASMLQDLLQSHDALFLGSGAQTARDACLPGQLLTGVTDALCYLESANRQHNPHSLAGKQVLVLGGGDSAMDCARTALRQGADKVTVVYRGSEAAMRASPKEKQAALAEGAYFRFEHKPMTVLGADWVSGMQFEVGNQNPPLSLTGMLQTEPRTMNVPCPSPHPPSAPPMVPPLPQGERAGQSRYATSTLTLACDVVIFAIGQINQTPEWLTHLGLDTDDAGAIVVDADGRTTHAKVYAGGDNTLGPDLVVTAVAAGRRAAHGILRDLHPGLLPRLFSHKPAVHHAAPRPVHHPATEYPA